MATRCQTPLRLASAGDRQGVRCGRRARALVEGAIAEHEELGHFRDEYILQYRLARIDEYEANWSSCEVGWRRALEIATALSGEWELSSIGALLSESLLRQGRLEEAERAVAEARKHLPPVDPWTHSEVFRAHALVLAHSGAHEEAERGAREAVGAARRFDSPPAQGDALLALAEVLALADRVDEARDEGARALAVYEQKEHLIGVRRARALLDQLPLRMLS
jgi:tetratricopeptide (TPR) repeat protein